MRGQLRLWAPPFVDLLAKLIAEADDPAPWRSSTWSGISLELRPAG